MSRGVGREWKKLGGNERSWEVVGVVYGSLEEFGGVRRNQEE